VKILITEKQLKRLSEANTLLDNLNDRIDPNKFSYEYGWRDSVIIPHQVFMEGSIEDKDITVHVNIGEVIYDGQDVTQFAKNYVFWSGEGNDSELAYNYKMFIVDKINNLLRVTPIKISEWDVHLGI
jgi:hypothetical protein